MRKGSSINTDKNPHGRCDQNAQANGHRRTNEGVDNTPARDAHRLLGILVRPLQVPPDLPDSAIEDLKRVLSNNPGKSDAYIHIAIPEKGETVIYLGKDMRVNLSASLKDEADKLISPGKTFIK